MRKPTPPIEHRSPPPEPDRCLCRAYASRANPPKGGTLIAEDVTELSEHERRLRMDGYRPRSCRRCGAPVHAHDHDSRLLLGEAEGSTEIARYRCAERESCGAVWRVLPAFLARHLWRAWWTVERAVLGEAPAPEVPVRTVQRWRTRLLSSAAVLVAALATAFDVPEVAKVVERAGYDVTRGELVAIYNTHVSADAHARARAAGAERLDRLAGEIHRLAAGVRLM